MASKFTDLTNRIFGKLTGIKPVEKTHNGHYKWLCQCDCGNQTIVFASNVLRGLTTSCGCASSELASARWTTHGLTKNNKKLVHVWHTMISRCTNPKYKFFSTYGGRGIKVCERWLRGFEFFYEDMGSSYKEGLTIDRIEVNGNYEKSNCRWITQKEQNRNKRNSNPIEINGQKKLACQWEEETGIPAITIVYRSKNKWSDEMILSPYKWAKRNGKMVKIGNLKLKLVQT